MSRLKKIHIAGDSIWNILRSPKTVALLKLGAAVVGVVHALDELRSSSASPKQPIGFKSHNPDDF